MPDTEAIPALRSFLPNLLKRLGVAMSRLTTHVLDTARGRPGEGIKVELYKIVDKNRYFLSSRTTNNDGRCDAPLLQGNDFQPGIYELDFHVGAYFAAAGVVNGAEPAFLGVVTLRFGVADTTQHYHVPLVVTPWSYSTYRGS
jgi:5-hydroxyisourate hydrolase